MTESNTTRPSATPTQTTTRLRVIIVSVILLAVFAGIIAFFVSAASADQSVTVPTLGAYVGDGMSAVVSNDKITINWEGDNDVQGLYWSGTFDSLVKPGDAIHSVGDTQLMAEQLLASQDSDKTFGFNGREITFKVSVAGATRTMHLRRN